MTRVSTEPLDEPPAPRAKPRKPWIWATSVFAVATIALLAWALTLKSDRDSAQADLTAAQQELASTQDELDTAKAGLEQQPTAELGRRDARGSRLRMRRERRY